MTDRELMQQALEALENAEDQLAKPYSTDARAAIAALRERLAQPEQEPFGYFQLDLRLDAWVQNRNSNKGVAFYTTPPRQEWVGLTEEDYAGIPLHLMGIVEWAEAKLKEKNA